MSRIVQLTISYLILSYIFQYKHPCTMGAIISSCCEEKQSFPLINKTPQHKKTTFHKGKNEEVYQISTQQVITKDIPYNKEGDKGLQEEEQFYDIDTFVEEREKSNLQPKKVNFQDFEVFGKYGEGSFGVVLQVGLKAEIQNRINIKYAMKRIPRQKLKNHKSLAGLKLQRQILATMSHPFITSLKFAFVDKDYFYLVMESAEGGDAGNLVKAGKHRELFKKIGEKGVQFIAACSILGLQYLHSKNILYRDFKAENILLFSDGYAKLSDFGLAKLINQQDELSKTHAGTALYNAPQMVLQMGYNRCVDFWALGVLIYELQTGEPPFKLEDVCSKLRFRRVAQQQQVIRKWRGHHLPHSLKDLVAGLLKFKPQDRLGVKSWDQLKKHIYFKDFDWQLLKQKQIASPIIELIQAFPVEIKFFRPLPKVKSSLNSMNEGYGSEQSWDFDYKYHH